MRRYLVARIMDSGVVPERYEGTSQIGPLSPLLAKGLRKLCNRLRLKVNETKTAGADATRGKFLGYTLWHRTGGRVKCAVAGKALETFKQHIREPTRRTVGRSCRR